MTTGRTVFNFLRVYADGHDFSTYTRKIGPFLWGYNEVNMTAPLTDAVKNVLLSNPVSITPGPINVFLDNTAVVGSHTVLASPSPRKLMVPVGIQAVPAMGDPVFCGVFGQKGYSELDDGGAVVCDVPLTFWNPPDILNYTKPWGVLLHPRGDETGPSTAIGFDDNGGSSTSGWWMMYQIFSMNAAGTVTIKVQDAATNLDASFADLSGATSGAIGYAATPVAGIVAGAITATVRKFLRFQVALAGGATTVNFALTLVRG